MALRIFSGSRIVLVALLLFLLSVGAEAQKKIVQVPVAPPTIPALPPPVPAAPTPAPTPTPIPTPVWFPFVIPPFDAEPTATDVSWLNSGPAGANGFLHANGEHFVDGKGKTVRLWGVNISFEGAFPSKEEALLIAAHLAKFGFNAVRLHQYEGYGAPRGIWKAGRVGPLRIAVPREIDPAQMDKFDFFVAELIKRGIYIDLNLHVGRKVNEQEGFPQAAALPEKDKGVNYYDERLIAAQKDFCRAMLTHVNPYTTRAYNEEPGLCAVEVDNESSLLSQWLDGSFAAIPGTYSKPLADSWNKWLRTKYTDPMLRAAWTESDEPLIQLNLLEVPDPQAQENPFAPDTLINTSIRSLRQFQFTTTAQAQGSMDVELLGGNAVNGLVWPSLTARLQALGTVPWAFQINRDGLDLKEGQVYTLTFWARTDTPRRISVNLWQDQAPSRYEGFSGYADIGIDWKQYTMTFRPKDADPQHSRLSWNLGNQLGTVQLSTIELHQGGRIGVPDDWTLANGVPLLDFKTTPILRARRDFAEYLARIEDILVVDMRNFLKTDLKVRVPLWHTQAEMGGWGGVWREMRSDAIDLHAYWKHPDFGATPPGTPGWRVGNASMTTAAGNDPLSSFAYYRVAGKPYVMTEWNSGQPNDYSSESLLMAAAYAAYQDWAGVFIFDYHSAGPYNRNTFFEFFSIDTHPAKMATAPAAALLYRRGGDNAQIGDVKPAKDSITLTVPTNTLWYEVADAPGYASAYPIMKTWFTAGAARTSALQAKPYIKFDDVPFATVSRAGIDTGTAFASDTGELIWNKSAPSNFLLNTPKTKIALGFLAGGSYDVDELHLDIPSDPTRFATFALSSLDGQEVSASKRLLLTVVGKVENSNMVWMPDRTSVTAWGVGPTVAEGVRGQVRLLTDTPGLHVWALDGNGKRRIEVPAVLEEGALSFEVAPEWQTLWYEISAE